jgi:rare lipoprotein A
LKYIIAAVFVLFVTSAQAKQTEFSGLISYYGGPHEYYYSATASGEKFFYKNLTAAHRKLPFGTKLKVTYRGKSVIVKVNDRGPYSGHRVLDVSYGAAKKIGLVGPGIGFAKMEIQ